MKDFFSLLLAAFLGVIAFQPSFAAEPQLVSSQLSPAFYGFLGGLIIVIALLIMAYWPRSSWQGSDHSDDSVSSQSADTSTSENDVDASTASEASAVDDEYESASREAIKKRMLEKADRAASETEDDQKTHADS